MCPLPKLFAGQNGDEAEYMKYEVPQDTQGLHVLYAPKCRPEAEAVDIIAVHGLGGDSFSTWTDKSNDKLWLRDFLPQSTAFANARIMTYGYDARAFINPRTDASTGRIFNFGQNLLNTLNSDRTIRGATKKPIIFIGHSLGGIVIKSALVHAKAKSDMYNDLLQSVRAIFFFGTPHQGADVATWTKHLRGISTVVGIRRARIMKDLERWSDALLELTVLFSGQTSHLAVRSFYETQKMYGVTVVQQASATLGLPNEQTCGLQGDHVSICKFESPQSAGYQIVLSSLEAVWIELQQSSGISVGPFSNIAETWNSLPSPPAQSQDFAKSNSEGDLEERFRALKGGDRA